MLSDIKQEFRSVSIRATLMSKTQNCFEVIRVSQRIKRFGAICSLTLQMTYFICKQNFRLKRYTPKDYIFVTSPSFFYKAALVTKYTKQTLKK